MFEQEKAGSPRSIVDIERDFKVPAYHRKQQQRRPLLMVLSKAAFAIHRPR